MIACIFDSPTIQPQSLSILGRHVLAILRTIDETNPVMIVHEMKHVSDNVARSASPTIVALTNHLGMYHSPRTRLGHLAHRCNHHQTSVLGWSCGGFSGFTHHHRVIDMLAYGQCRGRTHYRMYRSNIGDGAGGLLLGDE